MPVTICSSEIGRGCCPHPRVTAVAKKDCNRRAACPLPGQGEGSWREERADKKGQRSERTPAVTATPPRVPTAPWADEAKPKRARQLLTAVCRKRVVVA